MNCGVNSTAAGALFSCMPQSKCESIGGQCKNPRTSAYARPPRARLATPPPKANDGGPEQVHLIGGYSDEVTVVFMTHVAHNSTVELRQSSGVNSSFVFAGSRQVYTFMQDPSMWDDYHDDLFPFPDMKIKNCGPREYTNPDCIYTSGFVHSVKLTGLQANTRYEYRPLGLGQWRPFRMPAPVGQPVTFGVLADLGQTVDSLKVMRHLKNKVNTATGLDAVLFPGDLAYADGYADAWDFYGRLGEFLWDSVPTAYGIGNHEYNSGGENYANFLPRYGWPSAERSRSESNLWYSFEAGLAHVIMLCSYCEYTEGSMQRAWLEQDLRSVDRKQTPWVLALWHTPWYTISTAHSMKEGNVMRESMESVLYNYRVDVVMVGHVHAYERTAPVYANRTRCDGPIHIVIGDAGNHEGPACGRHPQQPDWAVFQEYSFGHGTLSIPNATHARWSWHRNQDRQDVFADDVWIQPASMRCSITEGGDAATLVI